MNSDYVCLDYKREARALMRLLDNKKDETPESIRRLIEVSPAEQSELRAILSAGSLTRFVSMLKYRAAVLEEFNRLVARRGHKDERERAA